MTTYRIKQIGSLGTGWAIERDGVITGSHPSPMVLGAYLEAILAGANEFDADDIAKAIEKRPPPTYEERLALLADGSAGVVPRSVQEVLSY
jgi:hypothetical protein